MSALNCAQSKARAVKSWTESEDIFRGRALKVERSKSPVHHQPPYLSREALAVGQSQATPKGQKRQLRNTGINFKKQAPDR
jgi:hypothetical protein